MMSRRRASPPTIIDSIILPRVGLPAAGERDTGDELEGAAEEKEHHLNEGTPSTGGRLDGWRGGAGHAAV